MAVAVRPLPALRTLSPPPAAPLSPRARSIPSSPVFRPPADFSIRACPSSPPSPFLRIRPAANSFRASLDDSSLKVPPPSPSTFAGDSATQLVDTAGTATSRDVKAEAQAISEVEVSSGGASSNGASTSTDYASGGGWEGGDAMMVHQPRPRLLWFVNSAAEERQIVDRAINGAIVGFAASVALAKVLTVDRDYWAGWTALEILRNAPQHNWSAYEAMLQSNPMFAKMCISGIVYTLGDWSAQCYEGRPILEFDRLRMARSGLVGFCLHGSLSHHYYHFCEWLFPFQTWWVVPLKVAFDQTLWAVIWNSIYYIALGILRFDRPDVIMRDLRATFWPLLTAGWKLWPFAHIVTYGVMPVEQRLLWVDMVELVWVTILSMLSNKMAEERAAEEEASGESVVLHFENGEVEARRIEILEEAALFSQSEEGSGRNRLH